MPVLVMHNKTLKYLSILSSLLAEQIPLALSNRATFTKYPHIPQNT